MYKCSGVVVSRCTNFRGSEIASSGGPMVDQWLTYNYGTGGAWLKPLMGKILFFSCPPLLSFITWSTPNSDKICCSDPRYVDDKVVRQNYLLFPFLCITSLHFLTFLFITFFQTLPWFLGRWSASLKSHVWNFYFSV